MYYYGTVKIQLFFVGGIYPGFKLIISEFLTICFVLSTNYRLQVFKSVGYQKEVSNFSPFSAAFFHF